MSEENNSKVPSHVGIIMDGNRRFSKRLMMSPYKGHEWGAKKIREALEWCRECGVRELTLYAFSIQNFNRPKAEFDYLMDLFRKNFDELKDDKRIYENRIRVNVIGRIGMFPDDVGQKMREIMELTKEHDAYILNFAMAYGGQEEIVDAAKRIAEQVREGRLDIDDIDKKTFSMNLYLSSEPDLIIRTGGEKRTSNFLAYQSVYSELFFVDKMWPEFEKKDWAAILEEYSKRERRFGAGSFNDIKQA
ncbi:di-trans,poly-cis-decaprenylcistransferase [Candidatus Woesearchaeota archaeon]|nr:di-trans,poly-cis-decaprenylcistransferase [Candidatus Woesearchaeota archaeon]